MTCQRALTKEINRRPRLAISILAIASKNLQTTTSDLSTKQSFLKHRWLDSTTNAMNMNLRKFRNGEGQGGLACCSPWGHKELDMTGWLKNNSTLKGRVGYFCEVKPAPPYRYRLKDVYKELFCEESGVIMCDRRLLFDWLSWGHKKLLLCMPSPFIC